MPSWARGSSYPWGVYSNCQEHISSPLECTRWCIRYQIFLPKFPQVYIINLLCYMSLISCLTTPFPCSSIIFCGKRKNKNKANKKKPQKWTNRKTHWKNNVCSWSHSDIFALCFCILCRHKNLQCFPAHYMHLTKISAHNSVIPSLLQFCFIAVTMDFCPFGLLKATENKGNVLQKTVVLWWKKKREALRWLITPFYTL